MSELESEIEKTIQGDYENKFDEFFDLMKWRVHEVLVISSLYDDFVIEVDRSYDELLFRQYNALNLSTIPPRIIRVSNSEDALELVKTRHFDLVITMSRIGGATNPFDLGTKIKKIVPNLTVILLLSSYADIPSLPRTGVGSGIDNVFVFTGNSDIFLAIIKHVEDLKNIDTDTQIGKVRVIIVVEDTIAYYSLFLPLIYFEIMRQTQTLVAQGLNQSHKLLLVRGRPKILLAKSYEQAIAYYDKYAEYVFAIVSDVTFALGTESKYKSAGKELVQHLRKNAPYLPILLQSSEMANKALAEELNVDFVYKHSAKLLKYVSRFLDKLGFGDFVFYDLSSQTEIARAKDFIEFEKVIKKIPIDSILYHGQRHHFSNWLFARSEFELAYALKSVTIDDFEDAEAIRQYLITFFKKLRAVKQEGVIVDFSSIDYDPTDPFTKIGQGSLGGKGRGLAFINSLLHKTHHYFSDKYPNIKISVPETVVITTERFDSFISENMLSDIVLGDISDEDLYDLIMSKDLPSSFRNEVYTIAKKVTYPIAVRSSSLLEDSQFQPFAGIYTTYLLPNNHKKWKGRAQHLIEAIKLVFASTFTKLAKGYIETIGQKIEIEKMAVVIQRIAGKERNGLFYPSFSGVGQSYNYYPFARMKSEDGIAHLALGLGGYVTSGRKYLSYCPKFPRILPQHSSIDLSLDNTQNNFFAVNLDQDIMYDKTIRDLKTLGTYDLSRAKEDGVLSWLGAVFDPQNYRINDGVSRDGPIVLTFPFVIKYNKFPLSDLLIDILEVGKQSFGCEVEIEFAVNLDYKNLQHEFYLLQIRPLVTETVPFEKDIAIYKPESVIYSTKVLGNGIYEGITDIVYVKPSAFKSTDTINIRDEIAQINAQMNADNREYILIGPGRWGTTDRFLGIPVKWDQIRNARAIVEVGLENFQVDASHGSHFFLNITSTRRAYFTVSYDSESTIDWNWLKDLPSFQDFDYVKHIRLSEPIDLLIDGKHGTGIIIKPGKMKEIDEK